MMKKRKSETQKQAEILTAMNSLFIKCHTREPFILKDELEGVAVTHVQTAINQLSFITKAAKKRGEAVPHNWTGGTPAEMAAKVYTRLCELIEVYNSTPITPGTATQPQLQLDETTTAPEKYTPAEDKSPAMIAMLQELLEIQRDTNEKITKLFNSLN